MLERNPYYYAVMPNGDQLPYVDEIQFTVITDPQVGKLQVEQGAIDYTQGSFNGLILSDVEGLRKSTKTAGTELVLWDSGSGTGSIFFLNYDYIEDDLRELFREPKFRQAISYAFDRDAVQKAVYFNTGEKTTGTLSAKAVDFQINQTGTDIYKPWRDAYVRHDPEKAKQLLDELGLKDTDGDGMRELPNGKKLALRLEYSADESAEHSAKGNQLVADLAKVGLKMTRTPIPPQSFDDQWMFGKLMAHTNWEVGDGHPLIYPGWIVPTQYPQLMVIKSDLMNVPRRENLALGGFVNPWIHPTPAVYDPECYYWQDPSKHT